ncbi:MAG: DUF1190 domain-containing protein [Ketobacteraceae bacterium]|nr:DUF1190 domain-containing protein [Ketobacteraceae bacterium]
MNRRKRSRFIDLRAMRKPAALTTAIVGTFVASGCSKQDATWYKTADDCIRDTECTDFCRTAYQKALVESQRSAPRYRSLSACEYDFGDKECYPRDNRYVPAIAGFMVPEGKDCDRRSSYPYYGRALYWPRSRYSDVNNQLVTGDGKKVGSPYSNNLSVSESMFQKSPASYKTLSRGGFGRTVRAASYSSRSSWGG